MRKLSSRKKDKKDNKRIKEAIENDNDKKTEKETDFQSEDQDGDKKTHTVSEDDEPVVKLKKTNSKEKSISKEKSVTKEKSITKENSVTKEKSVSKEIEKPARKSEAKKDSEESSNDEEYEVENIINDKFQRGKKYYLIRWKGFSSKDDSWEPESTLNCDEIIKKYLESANNPSTSKANKRKNSNKISSKSTNKRKVGSKTNLQQENGNVKKEEGVKEEKLKKEKSEEDESDEDEEAYWEVERIIDVHFLKNGEKEFLIRWKGYKSSHDSWEPEKNISCSELKEKFMRKFEEAKYVKQKELRAERKHTHRFTLMIHPRGRRLSKRNDGRQRAVYYDAE